MFSYGSAYVAPVRNEGPVSRHQQSTMLQYWFLSVVLCFLWMNVGQTFNPPSGTLQQKVPPSVVMPKGCTSTSIKNAFQKAQGVINSRNEISSRRRKFNHEHDTPSARHQTFLSGRPRSRRLEKVQEQFEEVTRTLSNDFSLTPDQVWAGLGQTNLKSIIEENHLETCEKEFDFPCRKDDRYRTFDGTCNNLRHSSWGMASSCYKRLVPPDYADGVSEKRVSFSGKPLPAPRKLSLEIHYNMDSPTALTHQFMSFGQFVDHDITLAPLSSGRNNERLVCCPLDEQDPPECDPILVAKNDPFYSSFGITCLNNARSARCPTCSLGPREQTNQVTSFLDASHVYGISEEESKRLRNNDGTGTLRSLTYPEAGELPPGSDTPENDQCSRQHQFLDCFQTGDIRANQHLALTSLHVLFLREHNRIARKLKRINRNWGEERLYQESRRIVGAIMQKIVYDEYLPLVIGLERMEWFDLNIRKRSYTEYDPSVHPAILNEFSAAAFRFGHTMISGLFPAIKGGPDSFEPLRNIFNSPFALYQGQLEKVVKGMTMSSCQGYDRYLVRDITNHLYQAPGNASGLDLASLNINRGRDHGIPGYTKLVEFCGGPTITRFSQLDKLFPKGLRHTFQKLYEDVRDIDLFSGGLAERPSRDAVVGPTFACIIGMQFKHLKFGDRFYFEHEDQEGSFTPGQLREIKKITLAKLMCQNSKVQKIQRNAFLFPTLKNPELKCSELPEMNFYAWRRYFDDDDD